MPHICLECYEIYEPHFLNLHTYDDYPNPCCPKSNCQGDIIELDELILPTIILLNRKGYYTTNCCSGHYYNDNSNSYISFDREVELPNLPEGYEYDAKLYPHVDWERHDEFGNYNSGMSCIRKYFNEKDSVLRYKAILKNAQTLLAWAKKLDNINV